MLVSYLPALGSHVLALEAGYLRKYSLSKEYTLKLMRVPVIMYLPALGSRFWILEAGGVDLSWTLVI